MTDYLRREDVLRRLSDAVNQRCSCGGAGPGNCCEFCEVYHAAAAVPQDPVAAAAVALAEALDSGVREVGTYYWIPFRHEESNASVALAAFREARDAEKPRA